jgi:hypothetical protein
VETESAATVVQTLASVTHVFTSICTREILSVAHTAVYGAPCCIQMILLCDLHYFAAFFITNVWLQLSKVKGPPSLDASMNHNKNVNPQSNFKTVIFVLDACFSERIVDRLKESVWSMRNHLSKFGPF